MKRSIRTSFVIIISLVLLSPYLSSWFPSIVGMPLGPILRQIAFGFIFIWALHEYWVRRDSIDNGVFCLYIFVCILTAVSFLLGPSSAVQYIVGVASFIFYPAIYLYALILIKSPRFADDKKSHLFFDKYFVRVFIGLAVVGSIDVFSDGWMVDFLGYNPNYGGAEFSLITSYNGVVRANAGVSDALAYGYVMSVAVIYFFNRALRIRSIVNVFGIVCCGLACMLSLTRGAIISAFLTCVVYMFSVRRLVIGIVIALPLMYVLYMSPYADLFLGRFTDSDEASETSSLLRVVMALNSIDFLGENPMGIGIGTQGAGNTLSDTDNRLNTDNYFFHIFLELGVFFAPFFVAMLIWQFALACREIRSRKFIASYGLLFLISSSLSSSIAFATFGVIYWFVLFLISLEARVYYE